MTKAEIKSLEQIESKLLNRIKNTQNVQQQAFNTLANAMDA